MEEKKKRNQYEFDKRKYDHIHLQVPKGQKDEIKAAADAAGFSLNAFIQKAIAEKMLREKSGPGE